MRVLIAGGGTGGHVYPALTIAQAFQEAHPESIIEFVGTDRGIETELVPRAGFKLHLIQVGRLNSNVDWSERFWTLVTLPWSLLQAALLVVRFNPDMVIGVGGYASAPPLLMAALLGKFTAIWEPNAVPGLANRWLSFFVDTAIVVFDKARTQLRTRRTHQIPMPVRKEMDQARLPIAKPPEFSVLVFGGSQGSVALNKVVVAAVKLATTQLRQVHLVHQTGSKNHSEVETQYATLNLKERGCQVECLPYIHDMFSRYQRADLVVCRAGTGSLSELAAMGKASLLVPLPTAADDHQTQNAQVLVGADAALMVRQDQFTAQFFLDTVQRLKDHPEAVLQLEDNIEKFHRPRAAAEIVNVLVGNSSCD
jgi:UDP-N-acetylglucosamine--N-acetylmuramyl-(pentapeptide) pyrophosphoryl-undecaprenol N-acetylglucosamine transferase